MPTPIDPFCSPSYAISQQFAQSAGATRTTPAIDPIHDAGTTVPDEPPTFHTVEEVARMLGVSTKTVNRRIRDGLIRKVPMGGRLVRISSAELQRLASAARL